MCREHLESEIEKCDHIIASTKPLDEAWDESVKKDSKSFAQLLKAEKILLSSMQDYFTGLSNRVDKFIDFNEYRRRAIKAYDIVVTIDSNEFEQELILLREAGYDGIQGSLVAGVSASTAEYAIQTALSEAHEAVLMAARKSTMRMAADVMPTIRNRIKQALETGISLGESNDEVSARIAKIIGNPSYAELIARTETVNAYASGIQLYGDETGAISKTWRAVLIGPCRVCSGLDGMTVGINENFPSIVGPIARPAAHPRCRCTIRLNYPEGE